MLHIARHHHNQQTGINRLDKLPAREGWRALDILSAPERLIKQSPAHFYAVR